MIVTDIERRRGDTALLRVSVVDSAGIAIDISGASFKLTVDPLQHPEDGASKIFEAVGSIVGDGSEGLVDFAIPGTGDPGVYYYDVQMTTAASKIETIATGKYTIVQDITK